MMGRNHAAWMGITLAAGMALVGCGQGGSRAGGNSFNSAAPEIKATWNTAVAADRTNDYIPALVGYKQVLSQRDQLSPAQVKAVEDASTRLFQRLADASSKGDAAAQQALATIRDMDRARRVPQ